MSVTFLICPPATSMRVPTAASLLRVMMVKRDTAAMLGRASPRNPRVRMENRSGSLAILLVA